MIERIETIDLSDPALMHLSPLERQALLALTQPCDAQTLQRKLGVSGDTFWAAMDRLADHGLLAQRPAPPATTVTRRGALQAALAAGAALVALPRMSRAAEPAGAAAATPTPTEAEAPAKARKLKAERKAKQHSEESKKAQLKQRKKEAHLKASKREKMERKQHSEAQQKAN